MIDHAKLAEQISNPQHCFIVTRCGNLVTHGVEVMTNSPRGFYKVLKRGKVPMRFTHLAAERLLKTPLFEGAKIVMEG